MLGYESTRPDRSNTSLPALVEPGSTVVETEGRDAPMGSSQRGRTGSTAYLEAGSTWAARAAGGAGFLDREPAILFASRRSGAANHIANPDPTMPGTTTQRTSDSPQLGRKP
jgi:hypothetical protein